MRRLFGLIVAFIYSLVVHAGESVLQPVDDIRIAAEHVANRNNPELKVQAMIDERLRLPRCQAELTAHLSNPSTAEVACPDMSGWRLYVPIRTSRVTRALVLTRSLNAGATITMDALTLESRDLARGPMDAVADPLLAIGQVTRRPLAVGSIISLSDLRASALVRRGQSVQLVARAPGVEVRMPGKVMSDASVGETVSVESSSSKRIITGTVSKTGEVEVPL
jgi:flagella basal body P-ring formation protein FlgA